MPAGHVPFGKWQMGRSGRLHVPAWQTTAMYSAATSFHLPQQTSSGAQSSGPSHAATMEGPLHAAADEHVCWVGGTCLAMQQIWPGAHVSGGQSTVGCGAAPPIPPPALPPPPADDALPPDEDEDEEALVLEPPPPPWPPVAPSPAEPPASPPLDVVVDGPPSATAPRMSINE
jgi:hypothetical protein